VCLTLLLQNKLNFSRDNLSPFVFTLQDFAVSRMSMDSKSSSKQGKKKRRKLSAGSVESMSQEGDTNSRLEQLRPLQPVLLTLESAMKADAHAGGGWIRTDDGNRFQALLTPLSKLFNAKVPSELPMKAVEDATADKASAYDRLVRGVGTLEYGNVVGCITAMAAAVGNEQMWKPLNHAILGACGNEDRREVCKAGVTALLSIIRTTGEEYMVLLPESLPVLSELLEHSDEEISAMAKECIHLGEELLGESLDL
jgi:hypothetical protein